MKKGQNFILNPEFQFIQLELFKSLSQSIEEMIMEMRENNFAFKKLRITFTSCSSQP